MELCMAEPHISYMMARTQRVTQRENRNPVIVYVASRGPLQNGKGYAHVRARRNLSMDRQMVQRMLKRNEGFTGGYVRYVFH